MIEIDLVFLIGIVMGFLAGFIYRTLFRFSGLDHPELVKRLFEEYKRDGRYD